MQNISSSAAFADSKPHYELLDGLRGIAALLVIWYHIFEGFATSPIDQRFNHGYLAVDFFFILSGFVVGYAYDDRWKTTMNTKDFFKRRLIRLHPMVILGAVLGAITFCIQGCEKWDGTQVSISMVMLALLLNLFLIPAVPGSGSEVRGNGEMYPLNGPSWSLFFEYREYSVCPVYPPVLDQTADRACHSGGDRTGFICCMQSFRLWAFRCRLVIAGL